MRDDQITRLQALSERLGEVVITEVDPNNWPAANKLPAELTQEERGNRYWCKKNAAATMTLLLKVVNIAGIMNRQKPAPDAGHAVDELDGELAAAEREAQAIIERMQKAGNVN
ncbi:hypothetical protein [Pseudomonas sp. NBRC 111137]|uniref:Uncharacterized protein n=1 Tax=uncultured Caudovirales phage TaxID=2100421 RepID=A0A2H4J7H0_9CAUD|nr:hypothetical protein [Pseudomonas sp. NBRC 111137]ASN67374.1 hypothetical protein 8F7_3 [uncultured Caudovirales phage]ASN69815.1 hypothetical protein 3S18_5 [uncultured Caudovirales phage]ASN69908.1 hypothetical protein 7AX6_37 [uncultured Caudovirales phage]ASN70637.1 hypothetical protein 2AX5_7 [uncultured Caudovirales phage]ASN70731.1 hypothetical protein 9AX3_48 [uncultured Caudovirales phage]